MKGKIYGRSIITQSPTADLRITNVPMTPCTELGKLGLPAGRALSSALSLRSQVEELSPDEPAILKIIA